jgi:hypothetical protein
MDQPTPAIPADTVKPSQTTLLRRGSWSRFWLLWLLALVLMLPAFSPYLYHFAQADLDRIPTGYLATDYPYYMANARAHFEDGFSPLYALRNSPDPDTPKVYFQPQTFLLALIYKTTGGQILLSYALFWFVGALLFSRTAIALYERLIGLTSPAHWVGLLLFFWGGGLYTLAGLARIGLSGAGWSELFHFDPFGGWWFINMGRNLVLPLETYIHAIFFLTILLLIDRKWVWAMFAALVGSWAHPFSGVQLLLIVNTWLFVEKYIAKSPEPAWKQVWPAPVLLAMHLGYHKLLLPTISHDHYVLMEQWSISWTFSFVSQLLGYALVLAMVFMTVRKYRPVRQVLADPAQRLLIVWFFVTLGLVNHELFIRPVQPLHFTRGYDWTPLFLLGAPALVALIGWLLARERRPWGPPVCVVFCLFFTLDNIAWLADPWINKSSKVMHTAIYKTRAMQELIDRFKQPDVRDGLFVNLDFNSPVGYLITSETYVRTWTSHPACTPYFHSRIEMAEEFYATGRYPPEWDNRRLFLCFGPADRTVFPPFLRSMGATLFYRNDSYTVFVVEPAEVRRKTPALLPR